MRHSVIRYSMIVLVIGLVALAAGRTYAQTQPDNGFVFLGGSFGITPELTARISVAHLGDGSVRIGAPAITTIQILDPEGALIAQSNEIRVEPGKIRYWNASGYQILTAGYQGLGRLQVRARILVKTGDVDDAQPPLAFTVELIDSGTGRTVSHIDYNPYITVDYL
jgi:hypothetical protein